MKIFGKTDIGLTRLSNQDTFGFGELCDDAWFGLVCDGMGGENGGEIASEMARDVIIAKLCSEFHAGLDEDAVKNLMVTSIGVANNEVFDTSSRMPSLRGMGTTVVLVVAYKEKLHVIHVGDSRAYLCSSDGLYQLTRDHSFTEMLVEQGKITPEEARSHPDRHRLIRAVGADSEITAEYYVVPFEAGQKVLLCTDGLTNPGAESEIYKAVMQNTAEKACDLLINYALSCGGQDNITVVILEK